MRYLIAFILYIICNLASAGEENKYRNQIWIYTEDYVYLFQSCWTVVEQPDYLGNYCYGEFYTWGVPSPRQNDAQYTPMDMVIFSAPHGSAYFVDDGTKDCILLNKIVHDEGHDEDSHYNEYFVQCGDYIFKDGFEDRSANPPGE